MVSQLYLKITSRKEGLFDEGQFFVSTFNMFSGSVQCSLTRLQGTVWVWALKKKKTKALWVTRALLLLNVSAWNSSGPADFAFITIKYSIES